MDIKEFFEETFKNSPMKAMDVARKLIELESIEQYLNIMFGIELEIKVKQSQKLEGRFYGKVLLEKIT